MSSFVSTFSLFAPFVFCSCWHSTCGFIVSLCMNFPNVPHGRASPESILVFSVTSPTAISEVHLGPVSLRGSVRWHKWVSTELSAPEGASDAVNDWKAALVFRHTRAPLCVSFKADRRIMCPAPQLPPRPWSVPPQQLRLPWFEFASPCFMKYILSLILALLITLDKQPYVCF